jgi:flagellar hook assembly protein FlgD
VKVYDVLGQKVATLWEGSRGSGYYEASWNARNDAGQSVSTGVYFCRMDAQEFEFTATRRFTLLR